MARRWRSAPALAVEGVQTGDGRVIAADALYWTLDDGPLPLRWDREDDGGHAGAVLVGTIDTVERRPGGVVYAEGEIDDDGDDGAELVRVLETRGRIGVSVDLDDIAVEVVAVDPEEGADDGMELLLASGACSYGRPGVHPSAVVLRAGAGDPDPVTDPETETVPLYGFDVGEVVERLTRGRLRGGTAVDIAAFDQAAIELADAEAGETDDDEAEPVEGEDDEAEPVVASAGGAPARAVFEQPEPDVDSDLYVDQPGGVVAVPLTIDDDRRVFGHIAAWGVCHTGFPGQCVTAPRSPSGYAAFHTGAVRVAEGDTLAVGVLTVGTDHADLALFADGARDHYAHTGLAWADVRAVDGEHGVWVSGRLRPDVTDEQVAVLRASSPSGDWRSFDGQLDLCAVLAVNTPGFPVRREAVAASGLRQLAETSRPGLGMLDGRTEALVAAGRVQRCEDCARRAIEDAQGAALASGVAQAVVDALRPELAVLAALDARTRHLRADAAAHAAQRVHARRR